MDRGDQPTFKTHVEELNYWKDLAEKLFAEYVVVPYHYCNFIEIYFIHIVFT